jgi:hypothetical protein
MAVRRSSGVLSPFKSPLCLPFSRFAGVTISRYLLLGWCGIPTETPLNRVRLTLGLGTSDASFAMKSSRSNKVDTFRKCMDVGMPSSAWMRENGHMCRAITEGCL